MPILLNKRAKTDWYHNVRQQVLHCKDCAAGSCDYRLAFEAKNLPVPAHGVIKKLFAENALGKALLSLFRSIKKDPIENGLVKPGLMNHLAAYGLRIPFVTGVWADSRLVANGITSAGKAGLASRLNGSGGEAVFAQIGIGTGTTAFAAGNTTLETEVTASGGAASGVHVLSSAATTVSRTTTTVTNDTARITGTVSITGTIAITESGVFNANTNGVLLCRQTFSAVNVVSGDSFVPTWDISNA